MSEFVDKKVDKTMIKIFLKYYYDVTKYNILLSILFGFVALLAERNMIAVFCTSFVTGGFLGGHYFYHVFHDNEYFFYYNRGFSKEKLIIVSLLCTLAIFLLMVYLLDNSGIVL